MTTGIQDVEWLDAKVCELSAENARLRAALDIARTGLLKIERRCEEARTEITRAHEQKAPEKRCVHGTPESQVCGMCCGYK